MSGAYAKEFEKWLESTKDGESSKPRDPVQPGLAHPVDSEDEADVLIGCAESLSSDESQEITVDVAPILTDDEDNDNVSDSEVEEEPPILEPVPSVPNDQFHKSSNLDLDNGPRTCAKSAHKGHVDKKFCSKIPGLAKKGIDNNDAIKLECEKMKVSPVDEIKVVDEYSFRQSGNLFDKFNAISEQCDDDPPPLIPSPEALLIDNESNGENFNSKFLNTSPDFCAMEADSTSEIPRSNTEDCHDKKREKMPQIVSQGEVSIECDSTCMLGVSPNVVSPGFASNMDIEEACNHSDTHVAGRDPSGECYVESDSAPRPNDPLLSHPSGPESKEDDSMNRSCTWDQEYPMLEAAVSEEKKGINNHQDLLPEEPPVLSMSVPESLRRKRHTIDSVENMNSNAKRKCGVSALPFQSEKEYNIDSLIPQEKVETVPHIQHTDKRYKSSKKRDSDKGKKSHHSKSKSRCRSYSLVDMNKFVKRASELSHLQSQMYKLVSLLFPQIKCELNGMSPESVNFENVLYDLASTLLESSRDTPESFHLSSMEISNKESPADSENAQVCNNNVPKGADDNDCSDMNEQSQQKCPSKCITFQDKDRFDLSEHIPGSNSVKNLCPETNSQEEATFSETMIPQLSKLTLTTEKDKILKQQPSVVIKTDVSRALISFSRLACKILQLLLPDLNVNLCTVLGDSHHDVLNLIDHVILMNSGQE